MATQPSRQSWFPAVSKQPTPEEIARHLTQIYRAINDHDISIEILSGRSGSAPATVSVGVGPLKTGVVQKPVPTRRKIP